MVHRYLAATFIQRSSKEAVFITLLLKWSHWPLATTRIQRSLKINIQPKASPSENQWYGSACLTHLWTTSAPQSKSTVRGRQPCRATWAVGAGHRSNELNLSNTRAEGANITERKKSRFRSDPIKSLTTPAAHLYGQIRSSYRDMHGLQLRSVSYGSLKNTIVTTVDPYESTRTDSDWSIRFVYVQTFVKLPSWSTSIYVKHPWSTCTPHPRPGVFIILLMSIHIY